MNRAFLDTWKQNSGIICSQLLDGLLSGLLSGCIWIFKLFNFFL